MTGNLDPKAWLDMTHSFESRFSSLVGRVDQIYAACEKLGQRWDIMVSVLVDSCCLLNTAPHQLLSIL